MAELQILAVLSPDAVSTEAPSAENTADVMTSSRTASERRHSPAAEFQIYLHNICLATQYQKIHAEECLPASLGYPSLADRAGDLLRRRPGTLCAY